MILKMVCKRFGMFCKGFTFDYFTNALGWFAQLLELPSGIEQLVEAQIQCALGHGESSKVAQRTHQRDQVHR